MSLTSLNTSNVSVDISSQLSQSAERVSKSVRQLSSGNRITRAKDDVANLSVAATLQSRNAGLRSSIHNLAQANSMLQTAHSALSEIQTILQSMQQLTVQANSGILSLADRAFLDQRMQQMRQEIDHIANTTRFNGVSLLNVSQAEDFTPATINNSLSRAVEASGGADADQPIQSGLVSSLDFSDTANISGHPGAVTSITDASGSGNNATAATGNVQSGADTINGQNALTFDGNSFLQLADSADINTAPQNSRNVFVTFTTGDDVTSRQVVYEQGGTVNGFNIYIDNGVLYTGAWKGTGGNFDIHHSAAISANTTYTAGFTFDGAGAGFTGYLDGSVIGNAAVGEDQNNHPGDIGIGGMNQDSRFFDGSVSGSGLGFNGAIGELLNYANTLNAEQVQQNFTYLNAKWNFNAGTISAVGSYDADEVIAQDGALNLTLNGNGTVQGIERLDLSQSNHVHQISVENSYFDQLVDIRGNVLSIDATGNTEKLSVSTRGLQADHRVIIHGGEGNDNFSAIDNNNTIISYEKAGHMQIDLREGIARGQGVDTLHDIRYVQGSASHDIIRGSYGRDTLIGANGDDFIIDALGGIGEGKFFTENLVAYIDTSDLSSVQAPGGVVTQITDLSGNGNNALADTGNVTNGSSLGGRNALYFDAFSFLQIANTDDINTTGQSQRSIFVTFQTGQDVQQRQVIYEEGGGGNGYNIYIEDGQLYVGAWRNGSFELALSQQIEAQTAYSAGLVFDASGSQTFTGYLNDQVIGQRIVKDDQVAHGGEIGIGGRNGGSSFSGVDVSGDGDSFWGLIGDVLIYNDAFSEEEALSLQNHLILKRAFHTGGNDHLIGGAGQDTLDGGFGFDTLDGGEGYDTALYLGSAQEYSFSHNHDGDLIIQDLANSRGGSVDILRNIERVRFNDSDVHVYSASSKTLSFTINDQSIDSISVNLQDVTADSLFDGNAFNLLDSENIQRSSAIIHEAISRVTRIQADFGSNQTRVDFASIAMEDKLRNQIGALGLIADTDIALSSTDFANSIAENTLNSLIAVQVSGLKSSVVESLLNIDQAISPLQA